MITQIIFYTLLAALVIMLIALPILIVRRNRQSHGGDWDSERLEIGKMRQEYNVKHEPNPLPTQPKRWIDWR